VGVIIRWGLSAQKKRASSSAPAAIKFVPEFFDFFDPTPEEQNVVLVNAMTLRDAEEFIESCEHCNEEAPRFRSIASWIALPDPIRA